MRLWPRKTAPPPVVDVPGDVVGVKLAVSRQQELRGFSFEFYAAVDGEDVLPDIMHMYDAMRRGLDEAGYTTSLKMERESVWEVP